jgi:hypothetical protein
MNCKKKQQQQKIKLRPIFIYFKIFHLNGYHFFRINKILTLNKGFISFIHHSIIVFFFLISLSFILKSFKKIN